MNNNNNIQMKMINLLIVKTITILYKFINNLIQIKNFIINIQIYYTQSSFFIIIMNYLGLVLPKNVEPIAQYVLLVITLSLISLICFVNVSIYLI